MFLCPLIHWFKFFCSSAKKCLLCLSLSILPMCWFFLSGFCYFVRFLLKILFYSFISLFLLALPGNIWILRGIEWSLAFNDLTCYHLSRLYLLFLIIFCLLLKLRIFISEIPFSRCRWTIKICWVFQCIPYSYQIILRCQEKVVDFFLFVLDKHDPLYYLYPMVLQQWNLWKQSFPKIPFFNT